MTKEQALMELKTRAAELGIVVKEVSFQNVHTFEHQKDQFAVIDKMLGIKVS